MWNKTCKKIRRQYPTRKTLSYGPWNPARMKTRWTADIRRGVVPSGGTMQIPSLHASLRHTDETFNSVLIRQTFDLPARELVVSLFRCIHQVFKSDELEGIVGERGKREKNCTAECILFACAAILHRGCRCARWDRVYSAEITSKSLQSPARATRTCK